MSDASKDERWISARLWAEMRAGREWWDRPLNPTRRRTATVAVKCGRCDGKGAIASFSVRYSGVCFACGGNGFRLISRAAYLKRKARSTHE